VTAPKPPPPIGGNAGDVTAAVSTALLAAGSVATVQAALAGITGVTSAVMKKIFTERKFGAFITDALKAVPAPAPDGDAAEGVGESVERIAGEEQARARAAYLVTATIRLSKAYATGDFDTVTKAKAREDQLLAAHKDAVAHRDEQLKQLADAVAGQEPDADGKVLMGWYGDDNPNQCARCSAADGKNFDALTPPPIGWPGWVHPHCFCEAGPPHKGGGNVDDVSPTLRASNLEFGKGSKLWKYWTGAEGFARFGGSPNPWTTLRDALLSEGVPATQADGLATNIMMATPAGRALFKAHHQGKGRSTMETETRAAKIVEIRGPGTEQPEAKPGFTAKLVSYGVPDSYRTSWTKGVFTRALEQRAGEGHAIPVVWNHDWADPVGRVVSYRDESDGFYGDVEFDDFDAVPRARQAHAQLRSGTMGQFSFAFGRGEEEEDGQHRGVMKQTSVAAVQEFSIVLNGAVPGTGVQSVRSAQVDLDAMTDVFARHAKGEIDVAHALAEIRSAETRTAAKFEFRALDGTQTDGVDPAGVLAAVDAAMSGVADQLAKEDVEAARRYFSQAASRLSELQYLLGMVPTVDSDPYGDWRGAGKPSDPDPLLNAELREDPAVLRMAQAAADDEWAAALTSPLNTRSARHTVRAKMPAKPYGDVKYADPGYQKDKKKRYPLDTKEHVQAALSYIGQQKNASQYSSGDLAKVKAAINAAAKKFGIGSDK
jgi:HK97 family phage prohead protease